MTHQILGKLQYNLLNGKTKIKLYKTIDAAFEPNKNKPELCDLKKVITSTFTQSKKRLQVTYHTNIEDKIVFSFNVDSNNKPTKFCLIDKMEFN